MICYTIGLTNDSFEHIYVSGGSEVAEIYAGLNYTDPIFYATKTMTGNPPLTFESYPGGIMNYHIFGNSYQNGTPIPSDPIFPAACGDKTENLYNTFDITDNWYLNQNGSATTNNYWCVSAYIPVDSGRYTAVGIGRGAAPTYCCLYDVDKNFISSVQNDYTIFLDIPANCKYVRLSLRKVENEYLTAMFVAGETVPSSYIPYGYKIPITCGGETKTVYLDEPLRKIGDYADEIDFQTGTVTRRIKEIVLTGSENWREESTHVYRMEVPQVLSGNAYLNQICSHYVLANSYNGLINTDNSFGVSRRPALFIHDSRVANVAEFQSFLSAQYATGTPVTVYYVLETPTTESVTLPQIPTISGQNTLSFGTALQPSSVSITGHIKVTEYQELADSDDILLNDSNGEQLFIKQIV